MTNGDRIRSLARTIPEGRVVTCSDVSVETYGRPNCAQAVGSSLRIDVGNYPWWRVVNKGGRIPSIPAGYDCTQVQRLRKEGVRVEAGMVDLEVCRHKWANTRQEGAA